MDMDERTSEMLGRMIVTIDGPAGSGKSTTAKLVAGRLGLAYLDTGAMYRAVTLAVLREGVDPGDGESASRIAAGVDLSLAVTVNGSVFLLDGEDVEREIRGPDVSRAVSPVSRHPGVRRAMVRLQRSIGGRGGIVAEGRDTGSVVFPYAHLKVFLVADIETRAARRAEQLRGLGIEQDIGEVERNIAERDRIDSSRDASPLVMPAGAMAVDTSKMTIDEQVDLVERSAREAAEGLSRLSVGGGERDPFERMHPYYRISKWFVRSAARLLFGLRVHGEERIRFRENYLFTSNHISYMDPPIVGCALNREVWFLAKKELFRNRIFARLIRTYHAIPVDREGVDRRTMKRVMGKLRGGESILMFPEGTRSRNGELGELKSGLGFIAMQSGVSIVPVHVRGTNELGPCFRRKRRLEVRIGHPIRIPSWYRPSDRKRDYGVLASMVSEEMRMLREEATA